MIRIPQVGLAIVVLTSSVPNTSTHRPDVRPAVDSTEGWFRYFTGNWNCSGGFPSGRKLDATVSFTPDLGGRWLRYTHADVAPSSWKGGALWGHQARDSGITSVLHDNGSIRVYRSEGWRDGALVFLKDTSAMKIAGVAVAPPDRFTYRRVDDSTFWFGFELSKSGGWVVGDSLTCKRGG